MSIGPLNIKIRYDISLYMVDVGILDSQMLVMPYLLTFIFSPKYGFFYITLVYANILHEPVIHSTHST